MKPPPARIERSSVNPQTQTWKPAERHGARILYAEDDGAVRQLCHRLLSRSGYEIVSVADGEQAWVAIQKQDFDLIITDHDMPHCTGHDLISKLRHEHIHWPVIVTTGDAEVFRGPANEWLDIAAVIEKPFVIRELTAIVEHVVQGANMFAETR